MKTIFFAAVAAPSLLVGSALHADSGMPNPGSTHKNDGHSFIQISHVTEKEKAEGLTLNGISMLGRYDLGEQLFLRAEVEQASDKNVKEKAAEGALGYVLNPHAPIEYHIAGLLAYTQETAGGDSESAHAWGAELGCHAPLEQGLTLHAELAWLTDSEDSGVGAKLGLYYQMFEHLGLNAEYGRDDNSNQAFELGLRVNF